jgi:cell division protein FtsL
MNEDTATISASERSSDRKFQSSAIAVSTLVRKLLYCARLAAAVLVGCLLLIALQVVALEVSARLHIFPLFGFFFINLLIGLLLTGLIVISRKYSTRQIQVPIRRSWALPNRLRRLWVGLTSVLNIPKVKAQTRTAPKPVAVLLIIKRQRSEESQQKNRTAAA